MPSELYRFNPQPGKYLAFFGSLSLEGGLGLAIELARGAHLPLRVASWQDGTDGFPLPMPIELLMADSGVESLGELREEEKNDFLGEALACGTPVIAFHGGNAAEMIYDHVTGFACESLDEMVEVLPLIRDLDRRECRGAFEKRFSAERMTDRYLQLYERLVGAARSPRVFGASAVREVQADQRPVTVLS